jgi:hypothetical protein
MKRFISFKIIVCSVCLSANCYSQPGDLSFPRAKSNIYSTFALFPKDPMLLIIYDGVNIFNQSFLGVVHTKSINSIKTQRDSITDSNHILKYLGILEFTTNDGVNEVLKYIYATTDYWIKKYPLAAYYLNGKLLSDDAEKLYQLQNLKPDNIRQIQTLEPAKGKELLGEAASNGAILIRTN